MVHGSFAAPGASLVRRDGVPARPGKPAACRAVHGLDGLPPEVSSVVVESRLPEPGQLSSSSYEGEGYIIVRHPDTAVVTNALRRLVTGVRVELG